MKKLILSACILFLMSGCNSLFHDALNNTRVPDLRVLTGGSVEIWQNSQEGNFGAAATWSESLAGIAHGAAADLNNDFYTDFVVVTGEAGDIHVYMNNKNGTFTAHQLGAGAKKVVTLDVDNDGNTDLATLDSASEASIWVNDGTGAFSRDYEFTELPAAISIVDLATIDINEDSIQDILFLENELDSTEYITRLHPFTNTWQTSHSFEGQPSTQLLYLITSEKIKFFPADLDNDGLIDYPLALSDNSESNICFFAEGSTYSRTDLNGTYTSKFIIAADLNGDGYPDIFSGNDESNTIEFNNGDRTFTASTETYGTGGNHALLQDLNRDGTVDIVIASDGVDTVWFNDGQGVLTDSGQALGSTTSLCVFAGYFY